MIIPFHTISRVGNEEEVEDDEDEEDEEDASRMLACLCNSI